jgi:antirestriction protein
VDGVRCQEYFIISFDSDILGLYDYLGEYENIDELNHLAHLLKELSPSERETLEAVMDSDQHCGSVQDLINLTQNLDCYDFHPGVDNEEMLGRLYVEDMESLEVPDNIKPYFDFEAYGRDISMSVTAKEVYRPHRRLRFTSILLGVSFPRRLEKWS